MRGMLNFSEKTAILKFITNNNIKILNLCHIPEEARLKTLSFSTSDDNRIDDVLELGERVDGSSLFSFIEAGDSDIYITPRFDKAFINPFSLVPTLSILCDYLDENGIPLHIAPQNVLARAEAKLQSSSGILLKALGELEFYITAKQETELLFPGMPDRNYHDSSPFTKFEDIRNEALATLGLLGIPTKYGHSEVGRILCGDGTIMEQHEIEFTIQNLAEAAETIVLSKWVLRNVCLRRGVSVTFTPKINLDHAGNGMHIHLCGLKNRKNIVPNPDGDLSSEALCIIGGILKFAPSLAAFGNPIPVSYLRFIARKESPMHICWSARNRLALVRIPLWWKFKRPTEKLVGCHETFEYRAPDAFANPHLLLAGLTVAADWALENCSESSEIARDLHAEFTDEEKKKFRALPRSCAEAAHSLEADRRFYEAEDVFPEKLVDKTIQKLTEYKDQNLWKELQGKPEELQKLLTQYLHYG